MLRLAVIILCLSSAMALAQPDVTYLPLERELNGDVLVSNADPAASYRVSDDFTYVGGFAFNLRDIARVERHVWVEADDDGNVQGAVILQFERLLDGTDGTYGFSVPPIEEQSGGDFLFSPERLIFGDASYVHNTWAFNAAENVANDPGAESAVTAHFLAEHGYHMEDEVIMSRAVRAVGDDQRGEVILFYFEPLSRSGHVLSEFDPDGPITDDFAHLSHMVTSRHRAVLRVELNS